jgi:glycosyltransferase involved in cell wall biosynthesis
MVRDGCPRVTIVIPAYNENRHITPALIRIQEAVAANFECLVVVDSEHDDTIPFVNEIAELDPRFQILINDLGHGPAFAIRSGISSAKASTVVITMADGSDDPFAIDALVRLVERGAVIACASRYMPGGQQVGASALKSFLSRTAGKTLKRFARVGTHDATNSFKAYSKEFIESVGIESNSGFVLGLELVAKATRLRLPVGEIPTIWLERKTGNSRFQLRKWIPSYMAWYRFAYGPKLSADQLILKSRKIKQTANDKE